MTSSTYLTLLSVTNGRQILPLQTPSSLDSHQRLARRVQVNVGFDSLLELYNNLFHKLAIPITHVL